MTFIQASCLGPVAFEISNRAKVPTVADHQQEAHHPHACSQAGANQAHPTLKRR